MMHNYLVLWKEYVLLIRTLSENRARKKAYIHLAYLHDLSPDDIKVYRFVKLHQEEPIYRLYKTISIQSTQLG